MFSGLLLGHMLWVHAHAILCPETFHLTYSDQSHSLVYSWPKYNFLQEAFPDTPGGYNRCTTALVFYPFLCVTSFTLVVMFVSPLDVKSHEGRKRRDSVPGCRAAGALLPWAVCWLWMCLAHTCSVNVTEWEDSSTLLTGCSIYIWTHLIYCFSA